MTAKRVAGREAACARWTSYSAGDSNVRSSADWSADRQARASARPSWIRARAATICLLPCVRATGGGKARSMANIAAHLTELTAQDCNDLVFALKLFRHEKYKRLRYNSIAELILVDCDDSLAALRLWGPAALADKLERLTRAAEQALKRDDESPPRPR